MKKLLFIICFMPLFSYGGTIYKTLSDTVFIGSIPYRTATGELLLFNNTKDTTESVLYNTGGGKTEFKKVRLIRLNDSTYVFKIGTTVIGDSIKIHSGGSGGGGGGSGTVTDFIFTDGNGFDGTVTSSTTTPTLSLVGDTIFKFASVKRVLDSITALRSIRKVDSIYKKSTNRDLTYFKINGTEYSFNDSSGGILVLSNDTLSLGSSSVYLPFIPLSGTVSGSPVIGDIEIDGGDISIYRKNLDDDYYENIIFGQGSIVINSTDYNQTVETGTSLTINPNGIGLQSFDSTSRGISCEQDFSTNITDLDYTQKIYVDGQIADTANLLRSLIGSAGAQTLSRTFADSISLSISGGNTVKLPYAVDSVGATSDSIIVYKFGIRKSYTNGASGGASLSGLTAATATNTINNVAYQQNWQWNTLAADTGIVLSSSSAAAASNTQTVLAVNQTGANTNATQTTYGQRISNTKTGTSSTNIGLNISCSGATNNYGLTSDADLIVGGLRFGRGKFQGAFSEYSTAIGYEALNSSTTSNTCVAVGYKALSVITNQVQHVAIGVHAMSNATAYSDCVAIGHAVLGSVTGSSNTGVGAWSLTSAGSGNSNTALGAYSAYKFTTGSSNTFIGAQILFGGSNRGLTECTLVGMNSGYNLTGNTTTALGFSALYTKTSGANCVAIGYKAGYNVTTAANSVYIGNSLATSHATKNNIILLSDGSGNERIMVESDGRVGIGTTSPNASAILDLTSTTQGFLPPRMTTTQRDAISTPAAGLIIYNTTTNKLNVFTTTWEVITSL